ncbi:MAG: energy-coupling factor transporter transmembrane component T [Spirochaetia bacterium]|jgi:energy-coupling factor transporter transmembrane protein EcfT|nr:energy-coupling factor transporter transmembrane component T [Spirochaetia bacterium]
MLGFSIMLISVSFFRLIVLVPIILIVHYLSSIKMRSYIREGRFFIVMGSIILVFNYLSSGSLITGILHTLRFYLIVWMALLFTFTTDPLSISSGIYRLFKPFHLIRVRKFSIVIGLSLTILPLILDQILEIKEAMLSRCGMSPCTPFRNMRSLGIPLIDGILIKAENLSDAMESRLFTEDATPPEKISGTGGYKFIAVLLLSIAIILLGEKFIPSNGIYGVLIQQY